MRQPTGDSVDRSVDIVGRKSDGARRCNFGAGSAAEKWHVALTPPKNETFCQLATTTRLPSLIVVHLDIRLPDRGSKTLCTARCTRAYQSRVCCPNACKRRGVPTLASRHPITPLAVIPLFSEPLRAPVSSRTRKKRPRRGLNSRSPDRRLLRSEGEETNSRTP